MAVRFPLALLSFVLALAGCASRPELPGQTTPSTATKPDASLPAPGAAPRYRCENNLAFTVRFGDGTADIDAGPLGQDLLLRDAGGVTPQQTVYSSTRLKAEFGLDPAGRGAKLSYASPLLEARCIRD